MSRVTPLQAPLVSFPEGRYAPVRPIGDISLIATTSVSDKATSTSAVIVQPKRSQQSQRFVGSSIVLLRDTKKGETGEYIDLDKALWPVEVEAPAAAAALAPADGGEDQEMGEIGERLAEMPEPFEYPFED
jgi:26S proteasome regulatory subunit N2